MRRGGLCNFGWRLPPNLGSKTKHQKKKKRKKKPSVQHVVILNAAPVRNRHLPPRGARTVRPTRRRGKDGGCLACYDEERQTPLRAASSVATPPNVSTGNNAKQGSCQWCIRILATPPVLSCNSDRRVCSMCTRVRVAATFFLRHRLISPPPSGPGEWVPHTVCITVPLPLRRQCRRTRKLRPGPASHVSRPAPPISPFAPHWRLLLPYLARCASVPPDARYRSVVVIGGRRFVSPHTHADCRPQTARLTDPQAHRHRHATASCPKRPLPP